MTKCFVYSTFMLVGMHRTFWNGSFALWKQWFYCDEKYFMSIHHPLAWCRGNLFLTSLCSAGKPPKSLWKFITALIGFRVNIQHGTTNKLPRIIQRQSFKVAWKDLTNIHFWRLLTHVRPCEFCMWTTSCHTCVSYWTLNCSRDGEAFMALGPMMNLLPLKPWINHHRHHHHHQYHVNGRLLCHKV
jgi:hypothetical protein